LFTRESDGTLTGTVSKEQDRIGNDFLRVACSVGSRHTQDHDKGGVVWSGQIVADESAHRVRVIEVGQSESAGDVGEEENQDEETACLAAVAGHVVVGEDADQDTDGDQDAIWYL